MTNEKIIENRKKLVESLINEIESGTLPWDNGLRLCYNATTGKNYKGNNLIALFIASAKNDYKDPRWATFKQAQDNGWSVKPGEKAQSLEKYTIWDNKTKKPFDEKTIENLDETERFKYKQEYVKCYINTFNVFNAKQLRGIPNLDMHQLGVRNREIEKIITKTQCPIRFEGVDAYYSPSRDEISVPEGKNFKHVNNFYATILHEMAHSTGHSTRLNRDLSGRFGSELYAKEEIRAELASLFMQAEADNRMPIGKAIQSNTAAYLGSWVSVLKNDYLEFYKATSEANSICQFLNAPPKTMNVTRINKITKEFDKSNVMEMGM